MRTVIMRSIVACAPAPGPAEYHHTLDTRYAERVVASLHADPGFCSACGPECTACRESYGRRCGGDITVIDFPCSLPYLLEHPASCLPGNLPPHEVILAIAVHEQILIEVARSCRSWHTRAIIAPLEGPDWISAAARAEIREICEQSGIECAFPKPFCSFSPDTGEFLAQFREQFHIGRPEVDLDVTDGVITSAHVRSSAACGATYYVARWLVGRRLDEDIEMEVISRRFHSYPCTASMEWDAELDDTPLHVAAHAHVDIVSPLRSAHATHTAEAPMVMSPLGVMARKASPDNLKRIETAKEQVLAALECSPSLPLAGLKALPGVSPAALSSALLLLRKEGRISTSGTQVSKVRTTAWLDGRRTP